MSTANPSLRHSEFLKLYDEVLEAKARGNRRQVAVLTARLERERPMPFTYIERDDALKREHDLRLEIQRGMPTVEEMQQTGYGAQGIVQQHQAWQARNREALALWKTLRRRLFPYSDDPHLTNFEQFRPLAGENIGANPHGA